jgi:DNA-binding transcriptional LysR family regulator
METFVAVVETGSFSAAARRLKVGQPAVSKSVANLEDRLGAHLLLRSNRQLMPTETGRSYYAYARRALDEAEEAEQAVRGSALALTGSIRICAAVTFARLHVIPRLKAFLAAHPGLSIDVMLDDRNVDLLEESIDVALRMGELPDSVMTARRIGQSRRLIVATPAYLALAGTPGSPDDLVAHQAVVYDRAGGGSAWQFRKDGRDSSVVLSGRLRVSAAEGVRAVVLADMGLAVVSEWMFAPELANGGVVEVLPEWELPSIDLWAVYPSGRRTSAKVRAFVDHVQSTLDPGASSPARR